MASSPLKSPQLGWGLALPVLFLTAVGLGCIHATERGVSMADRSTDPGLSSAADGGWVVQAYRALGPLTMRQALFVVTGAGLLWLALGPSYQKLGRYSYWFYALVVALLALLAAARVSERLGLPPLPLVPKSRDVFRWVGIEPFRLQPSEFMKLALVLTLARYLRFRNSYRSWWGLLPPFALTLLPMVLILFQPDLGTLLMLLPVLFALLFVAGARVRHLLLIVVLGLAALPLFYAYGMQEYQKERIRVLLNQNTTNEAWHMDQGYQLRQSKIALGTGGLTGTGYGEGLFVQYEGLLPEDHNDFIFAIFGHQWGFLGGVLLLLAYGAIVLFGLEVASTTNDPFGRLLAVGVVVMIVVQALLNIGMNIGLAPITGMPLPFVSAGGSSLWANFLALGLLLNVARRRPLLIAEPPFEHTD
jgi:cell division protein FtsW (lipid II flippase)